MNECCCGVNTTNSKLCCCDFGNCENKSIAPSTPAKSEEENLSLIDERQVELLDGYRAARDLAARHAQSKADRASLMRIQASALDLEAEELINEINEATPMPAGE